MIVQRAFDQDELLRRTPPHNLEHERAVLGAILADVRALPIAQASLSPEDFYARAHQLLYLVILERASRGLSYDMASLVGDLQQQGALEEAGGARAIAELTTYKPSSANVSVHVEGVLECAKRRRVIIALAEGQREVFEGRAGDGGEVLRNVERRVAAACARREKNEPAPISACLDLAMREHTRRQREGPLEIPTGIRSLDLLITGIPPRALTLIAARPSVGKTSFALNLVRLLTVDRDTRKARPVAFFSLEVVSADLGLQLACSTAQLNVHRVRRCEINQDEDRGLLDAAERLYHERIYVDDSNVSALELRAKARRLVDEHRIEIVFVDYLQLMRPDAPGNKPRHEVVAEISRSLKSLALELGVAVVALAQLNRAAESRTDGRPRLSDLRESGSLEQDADVVILLHRETMSLSPEDREKHETSQRRVLDSDAIAIVAKNRFGPTGDVALSFDPIRTRFGERGEYSRARFGT